MSCSICECSDGIYRNLKGIPKTPDINPNGGDMYVL